MNDNHLSFKKTRTEQLFSFTERKLKTIIFYVDSKSFRNAKQKVDNNTYKMNNYNIQKAQIAYKRH